MKIPYFLESCSFDTDLNKSFYTWYYFPPGLINNDGTIKQIYFSGSEQELQQYLLTINPLTGI